MKGACRNVQCRYSLSIVGPSEARPSPADWSQEQYWKLGKGNGYGKSGVSLHLGVRLCGWNTTVFGKFLEFARDGTEKTACSEVVVWSSADVNVTSDLSATLVSTLSLLEQRANLPQYG
jgi:hypothetical protein